MCSLSLYAVGCRGLASIFLWLCFWKLVTSAPNMPTESLASMGLTDTWAYNGCQGEGQLTPRKFGAIAPQVFSLKKFLSTSEGIILLAFLQKTCLLITDFIPPDVASHTHCHSSKSQLLQLIASFWQSDLSLGDKRSFSKVSHKLLPSFEEGLTVTLLITWLSFTFKVYARKITSRRNAFCYSHFRFQKATVTLLESFCSFSDIFCCQLPLFCFLLSGRITKPVYTVKIK